MGSGGPAVEGRCCQWRSTLGWQRGDVSGGWNCWCAGCWVLGAGGQWLECRTVRASVVWATGASLSCMCWTRPLGQRSAGLRELHPEPEWVHRLISQRSGPRDWSEGRWGLPGLMQAHEWGAVCWRENYHPEFPGGPTSALTIRSCHQQVTFSPPIGCRS